VYIFTSCEGFSPKSIEIGLEYAVERKSPMGNIDTGIDEKRYLGKYSGYNNYGLGVTFGFIASDFGIVTLYFMALAIYFYTYCYNLNI
jgi:hypothetical protein